MDNDQFMLAMGSIVLFIEMLQHVSERPQVSSQLFSTINNHDIMQILIASSIFYNLQLCDNLNVMGFDFEYWVKPHSITWFLIFN